MDNEKYGIELDLVWDKFKNKIQQVKSTFKGLSNEKINLNANTAQIEYLKRQIGDLTADLQVNAKTHFWNDTETAKAKAKLEKLTNQYNKLISKQNEVGVTAVKSSNNISKSINKMTSKIRRFGLSLLSVRSIFSLVSRASSAYLAQDTALANRLQSVWTNLGALLSPIIEGIVNILAKAVKYIAIFIKALTGVDLLARATAKSMKGTAGSAKALNKALAGFDELNNLDTDAGGGAGGDIGLGGLEDVAINMALVEKLKTAFIQLKEILRQVWESAPVQAFVDFATTYGQFLFDYWSSLGSNLWENLKMTWENISGDVGIALDNMSLLWTTFWSDLSTGIQTWGQPIINGVTKIFNSIWKDAIDPAIKIITKAWADFSGILLDLWNQYGKPLVDNIGEFVTTTIALFQKIWDDILAPIITPFLEMLSELWDKHLKGVVEEVGGFVMELINDALEIYNKFIAPIVSALIDKLAPVFAYIGSLISGVMGTVLGVISDVIGGIIKIFKGIIEFITGVFTGNWKKAWKGVRDIFSGIISGLAGIFKAPINLIIDGINAFTRGLNKIKIPDWVPGVGGKGFNIAKIPKLSVGTNYVPEDQVAMIHKGEAVIPKKFNSKEYFANNDETNALLERVIEAIDNIEINPYTTVRDVGKASLNYINSKSRQLGESVVV